MSPMRETPEAITVDLKKRCAECGAAGATPSGLCLTCGGRRVIDRLKKGADGAMPEQLSLATEYVELTTEERAELGQRLAAAWRRLRLVLKEHKERRKEMREEREALEAECSALAEVVRSGREERPVAMTRG